MRPTLRLGQDGACDGPAILRVAPRNSYSAVALATSMLTPGPMVELSDTFFM
jgi:hypothetical protein